jgi:hypothetical protein
MERTSFWMLEKSGDRAAVDEEDRERAECP